MWRCLFYSFACDRLYLRPSAFIYRTKRLIQYSVPHKYQFPGLKPGDRWCLCASRWQEALDAGVAPPVVLSATHARALEVVSLDDLKKNAQ